MYNHGEYCKGRVCMGEYMKIEADVRRRLNSSVNHICVSCVGPVSYLWPGSFS